LYGYHFFFLAPLLHVVLRSYVEGVSSPPDWRDWLGLMAVINLFGLLAYSIGIRFRLRRSAPVTKRRLVRERRFRWVLAGSLIVAASFQAYTYRHFGGILGLISGYTFYPDSFAGWGWIFWTGEALPLLVLTGYVVWRKEITRGVSLMELLLVFTAFLFATLIFGGLRGSRVAIVWPTLWAVGMLHLWLRPLRIAAILPAGVLIVLFAVGYLDFKVRGARFIEDVFEGRQAAVSSWRIPILTSVLLGDLGRADIQALILYRQSRADSDVPFALGRTYFGAATLLIPARVWPSRPETKAREGTEIQYGRYSYGPGLRSSRQYGLSGEALLNFGIAGVPLMFFVLGIASRRTRQSIKDLSEDDIRRLLLPLPVLLCVAALIYDSDGIVLLIVKSLPVIAVIYAGSVGRKWSRRLQRG
jgi:hypothetical protein